MHPVLSGLGIVLHVPGLMALMSIPVCILFREFEGIPGFVATAAASLAAGQMLYWRFRGEAALQRGQAMLLAAVAWIVVPFLGTLPYLGSAWQGTAEGASIAPGFRVFSSALFESVSGFTATGLSVAARPDQLPHHLQWWRSFTEWVGGIGIIVLLVSIMPVNRNALQLYFSEGGKDKIMPSVKSSVRTIWLIYVVYTFAAAALLWLAGEPAWVAVNHGMTGMATGGFTVTGDSLAGSSVALQLTYLVIMITGAISFAVHYKAIREKRVLRTLFGRVEQKFFWSLLVGGALLATALQRVFAGEWHWMAGIVQWVSALTTTGFSTDSVADWSPAAILVLISGMLIGANAGSTGSGIKQVRFAVLIHDIAWTLRSARGPAHEIKRVNFGDERLTPDEMTRRVHAAAALVTAFLLTWLAGSLLLFVFVPAGTPFEHVLFESLSAQSNTGLSSGITGPDMTAGARYTLMVQMIAGRLEIFPILLILAYFFHGGRTSR